MRKTAARLAIALSLGVYAGAASAAQTGAAPASDPAATAPAAPVAMPKPFTDPEYVMGSPRAKVTVVEYASASCPHCARFDAEVFPAFKAKYVDTGKVRYVFREFLTPPAEVAAAGFLLARCAGRDRYFHVVEQVFAAQPEIYNSSDPKAVFERIAKDNGLNAQQMFTCLTDKAGTDALNARIQQAVNVEKITSTPTFLINGVKLDEHGKEPDLALFDAALKPLLRRR